MQPIEIRLIDDIAVDEDESRYPDASQESRNSGPGTGRVCQLVEKYERVMIRL